MSLGFLIPIRQAPVLADLAPQPRWHPLDSKCGGTILSNPAVVTRSHPLPLVSLRMLCGLLQLASTLRYAARASTVAMSEHETQVEIPKLCSEALDCGSGAIGNGNGRVCKLSGGSGAQHDARTSSSSGARSQ